MTTTNEEAPTKAPAEPIIVSAAIFHGADRDITIERIQLAAPGPGLVRVRMAASGVCHSDLHVINGDWPIETPLVLGHEGAGIVESVGEGVRGLDVGDHVILSWLAPCSRCGYCVTGRPWACTDSGALHNRMPDGSIPALLGDTPAPPFIGVGTMAEAVVVPESAAIKVPDEVPLDVAALIGCSVTTGVGAVVNTAAVNAGQTAVVIGCGGVGLAIVMGLALVGATTIIAVDLSEERLEAARAFGATHTLDGSRKDLREAVHDLTDGGADAVFEATGILPLISGMQYYLRAEGKAVIVGLPATGTTTPFDPYDISDRSLRILGCNYGSSVPSRDFIRLAELQTVGKLPLDRLVGQRRPLSQLAEALDDLGNAVGLRTVIDFDLPDSASKPASRADAHESSSHESASRSALSTRTASRSAQSGSAQSRSAQSGK